MFIQPNFEFIKTEFSDLGIDVSVKLKELISPIESAFLKEDTYWGLVTINSNFEGITNLPHVKIKIEIDRAPPLLFDKEIKTLHKP